MNRKEYLLVQLASECNEVAHRVTKALHFGLDEVQNGQSLTNEARMREELDDLLAVVEILGDEGILTGPVIDQGVPYGVTKDIVDAKRAKIEKYMEIARREGTLAE